MEVELPPDSLESSSVERNTNSEVFKFVSRPCSVLLNREDLQRLKEVFISNSKTNLSNDCNLKCSICHKVYLSEKKLLNHQENKHMIFYKPENKVQKRVSFSDKIIVHEVKEYHKCRKCPKIFEDYNSLKVHMKQIHKKRRCYICFYCSKDFIDRTFFKVHIKMHCDVCGLLLPKKKNYLEHRRTTCKIPKKYDCKTCPLTFFHFMDLKDHSYEHTGTLFICDICKDQFESKCVLAHHIKFLHTKRKPRGLFAIRSFGIDRVYLCNFCDESSVDRELIEKHVSALPDFRKRAMTGYKDFYFCDQCSKKFSTETAMLQHKWSHFLKASDNSQSWESCSSKILKRKYKMHEKLPTSLQPKVVLERLELRGAYITKTHFNFVDVTNFDFNGTIKKPIVDPKSKKTIISNHQCEKCAKYLSTNYCLNRHMHTVHGVRKDDSNCDSLQCNMCEEIFVWPSLLQSHNCIRMTIPEMQLNDARPDIHFDNMFDLHQNGFDGMTIDNDDYMNSVDFDIPAPIVELTEYENLNIVVNCGNGQLNVVNNDKDYALGSVINGGSAQINVLNNDKSYTLGSVVNGGNGQLNVVHNDKGYALGSVVNGCNGQLNGVHNDKGYALGSVNSGNGQLNVVHNNKDYVVNSLGYKVVQEVPIEF